MSKDFKQLPWMSDATKKQAQVKLDAIAITSAIPTSGAITAP